MFLHQSVGVYTEVMAFDAVPETVDKIFPVSFLPEEALTVQGP
jgi:hypothetical protein